MRIEHVGLNVREPPAVARWYADHLGFQVKRKLTGPPYTHFLADTSGKVMVEIYSNPAAPVPDYASMDPLVFHMALTVDDVEKTRAALLDAGATPVGDVITTADGDRLALLRDPWGLALQLVRRGQPIL